MASVLERRSGLPLKDYLALIVMRDNIRRLVMDYGYLPEERHSYEEVKTLLESTSCQIWYVLRLETLIERLILENQAFGRFLDAYTSELSELRQRGVAALQSIIAYRTGLNIRRTDSRQASDAFEHVKDQSQGGAVRIASKSLLDF